MFSNVGLLPNIRISTGTAKCRVSIVPVIIVYCQNVSIEFKWCQMLILEFHSLLFNTCLDISFVSYPHLWGVPLVWILHKAKLCGVPTWRGCKWGISRSARQVVTWHTAHCPMVKRLNIDMIYKKVSYDKGYGFTVSYVHAGWPNAVSMSCGHPVICTPASLEAWNKIYKWHLVS